MDLNGRGVAIWTKIAIFIKMHVKERNATSGTIVITIMPAHIY